MVSEEQVISTELGYGAQEASRWVRAVAEEQWWCAVCGELRTRAELEGCERADGQAVYSCLACGEPVEELPF
jgi:hypothetical protein